MIVYTIATFPFQTLIQVKLCCICICVYLFGE